MVGPLLRNGGGLFIRRVFGSDELYKSIFYEYLALLLQSGHNLEVFIEGTRCLLSSSLVRKSDGSVIRAGDVRSGMQLAGESGPVTVTSAESDSRPKASTSTFYRVNLRDGSSYTVTPLHKVTLRMRGMNMAQLKFVAGKGTMQPRVFFLLFDRRTLKLRKWGQRSVRISEDKDDPLYSADVSKDCHAEDAGSASRIRRPTLVAANRADATAAMWDLLEKAAALHPDSLAATYLTTGDTIDVEVEKLYASNFGSLNQSTNDDEDSQEGEEQEDEDDSAAQDEHDDEDSCEGEKGETVTAAAAGGPTFVVVGSTSVAKAPPANGQLVIKNTWRWCLTNVRMPENLALIAPAAHVIDDDFKDRLNPYLLMDRTPSGAFTYRQLQTGDSVRVLILLDNPLKHAAQHNVERIVQDLAIFDTAAVPGVVVGELNAVEHGESDEIDSTAAIFDSAIESNMRVLLDVMCVEVIIACGRFNIARWAVFAACMDGVEEHAVDDELVSFLYTPKGGVQRRVKIILAPHPDQKRAIAPLKAAMQAAYGMTMHVGGDHALVIRSIEELQYDEAQEFARIEVDGNHRYQLCDGTLTHNSRSGKVKRPKIGVLSVLIDLLASGRLGDKDVMLVPIAISYDKVIEGSSYVNEMLGAKVSRTHHRGMRTEARENW